MPIRRFGPTIETALIGEPAAILLVEFAGDDKAALLHAPAAAGRADGRPGSAGQRGRDGRRGAAEEPVGGAQGRPQHHDEPEGRRQAGELHRGLRRAARASRRLHRRADRGVRAPRHARHLVRARLRRHAARAADPRHAPRRRAPRCAPSPRKRRSWCANTRAPSAASTATACAAANGSPGSSGPALTEAFRAIKQELDPSGLFNPGKIVDPPRMDDGALFRFPPPSARGAVPDDRARRRRSTGRRGTCRTIRSPNAITAPGSGGDPTGGFAKAVEMCNNNGHCRKFDAGTMCPSYRVTRDEQHVTRGRANTLRLALSGQLGADALTSEADARRDGSVRVLQGLQARMPDRRRHGEDEDRVPRPLQEAPRLHAEGPADRPSARLCACREPRAVARRTCATAFPARRALGEKLLGLSARRAPAAMASRHLLARPRPRRCSPAPRRRSPPPGPAPRRGRCSSIPSTASSRARTRSPRRAC